VSYEGHATEVPEPFVLRLFVTGNTARSLRAIEAIRAVCEEHLADGYRLEVIDIHQQPEMARREQLIAAPTLIKQSPLPVRRLVGDMSRRARVLAGLGLPPE
jgi:circadian clock protein KaiB